MGKATKRRPCPAVGHEITPAECAENRNSRYRCPAECPYNPFAPQNYEQLLALEAAVNAKAMDRLHAETPAGSVTERELAQAARAKSPHTFNGLYQWHLFFKRDAAGLTLVQRWEQAGFAGLEKNDERAVLRAMMQSRVVLFEIHRVLDTQRTEVVDLLAPGSAPMLVVDRSLAASGLRFATFLAWAFALPHFWRLSGSAALVPALGPFPPLTVVSAIVRHLGGPTAEPDLRLWLAEYFRQFDDALAATAQARAQDMFRHIDAQFGKAVYELQAPLAECRAALDAVPDVEQEEPAPEETREGFSEARAWFGVGNPDHQALQAALAGQPILGRVLLGQSCWRLEAMGAARLAELRARFEQQLGPRVRFAGERRDDLGARQAQREASFDPALVPPPLLEEPDRLIVGSAALPPPPPGQSLPQTERELLAAFERRFPDEPLPALDNRTPRQAAGDPALRPKLIQLMKERVRAHDQENLRSGRAEDINWLLRELGLNEILFDPPPPRPPLDLRSLAEPMEEPAGEEAFPEPLSPPPPLPPQPLTLEEVSVRLRQAMAPFATAAEAMAELEAQGATWLDDLYELTEGRLSEEQFSVLVPLLLQVWFAFVPPGCTAPDLGLEDLISAGDDVAADLQQTLEPGGPSVMDVLFDRCRQPMLAQAAAGELLNLQAQLPKKQRFNQDEKLSALVTLRTAIDALDRALRLTAL
jgi:hypothetical protein